MYSRKEQIIRCLTDAFDPIYLDVVDESNKHHVPDNAQSHFKVIVVSEKFSQIPKLKRHQQINTALNDEFRNGFHALSIQALSQDEWKKANTYQSPRCKGGFKRG